MSAPPILPSRFDAVAIFASGLCLVHCLALPALLLLIPAWTAWLAVPEGYHLWMLASRRDVRQDRRRDAFLRRW
jgi:hypothetical protein